MKVHMITEQSVIFKTKKAGLTGEDQTKTIDVDIFFRFCLMILLIYRQV